MSTSLLEVKNLSVEYWRGKEKIPALRNISLRLNTQETLGIVGESGSGKSTLALAILRLISSQEGRVTQGEVLWKGKNVLSFSFEEFRKLRGNEIGIVFQDPFSSLNPVHTLGKQIEEAILVHNPCPPKELREKTIELFQRVRLDDAERIYHSYPHQISGGQRQRVLIAMAIANRPELLICDEATTALDVTIQKEILELLLRLQSELKMAILLITHHLGIVAHYSSRVSVLQSGEIVEEGNTQEVLKTPRHAYTQELVQSLELRGHHT
ncbi:MAG: ABC transporter ATP-binding protein [Elusimicrobia bacterium]|nr:ABC transporter ATP-binding protein [Elusimicrobiota bacterium]